MKDAGQEYETMIATTNGTTNGTATPKPKGNRKRKTADAPSIAEAVPVRGMPRFITLAST